MKNRDSTLRAIGRRMDENDEKWGKERARYPKPDLQRWFIILSEEMGEIAREFQEAPAGTPWGDPTRLHHEILDLAAGAGHMLEHLHQFEGYWYMEVVSEDDQE